jgi:hypothetical protein
MLFTFVYFRTSIESTNFEDLDAIELATIKVSDDAPTSEEPATVAAPRSVCKSVGRSSASGQRTPPPLYSMEELYS